VFGALARALDGCPSCGHQGGDVVVVEVGAHRPKVRPGGGSRPPASVDRAGRRPMAACDQLAASGAIAGCVHQGWAVDPIDEAHP
jgi:hypothetical protein